MRKALIAIASLFALTLAADEINIGGDAPAFKLVNAVDSRDVAFKPGDGKLSVVVFTCNQCPYAKAFEPRLIELAKRYQSKGVAFYAIDSNDDAKYDVETLQNMKDRAVGQGYPFPYLKDGDSKVARAYGARVTPHVFVVDGEGKVTYKGYVDDSAKPEQRKTTGLTDALNSMMNGRDVATTSTNAFGCSIKWKS